MNLQRVSLSGRSFSAYLSLIIYLGLAWAPSERLCAQGTVLFANDSTTLIYAYQGATFGPAPTGNAFQVALYYAPAGTPGPEFDFAAVQLGNSVGFSPVAGRFNGGARTAPTATPGGLGLFQVRGWETAYGSSYEEAVASGTCRFGASAILLIQTGNPTTTPPDPPARLVPGGFQSFAISAFVCPEPPPLTLAGIVAAIVMAYRLLVKKPE